MTISVGGILSGIDTSSIISQLVQIERIPINALEDRKSENNTKLSAFQMVNTKLSALLSVVEGMDTTEEFVAKKGGFTNNNTSDNNSVISLSVTSSVSAGSFETVISQLALADKWIHQGVNDQDASISSTTGNFTFTYAGTETNISVTANSTTLAGLKNAINNASVGVTATIINTGESSSNYKLILTADSTGTNNTITISTGSVFGSGFSRQQTARDSIITLDGTQISRDSNLLTDVVEGVSITLDSVGSGTITFSNDIDTMKGKINQFVDSYNDLISFINKQLAYDTVSGSTGTLFANTTLINLENTVKGIITNSIPGLSGDYTRLSQIGLKTDESTGEVSITGSDLSDALEDDFDGVAKLFTSFRSASDSRATFIGFTSETEAGTYELLGKANFAAQGFSGIMIRKQGESKYREVDRSGDYYTGRSGNDEEGLIVRVDGNIFGDYGTVTLSLGIAAQLTREITTLTDQSINGPIVTEINALTDTIEDMDDQIEDATERLVLYENRTRAKFVNLEIQLNRLQAQGDFLTSALSGLGKMFSKK